MNVLFDAKTEKDKLIVDKISKLLVEYNISTNFDISASMNEDYILFLKTDADKLNLFWNLYYHSGLFLNDKIEELQLFNYFKEILKCRFSEIKYKDRDDKLEREYVKHFYNLISKINFDYLFSEQLSINLKEFLDKMVRDFKTVYSGWL